MIARGWEEGGKGSQYLMDIEFQFGKMKGVMEMDSGDGCTVMYLIPMNYTLKNG